MRTITVVLAAAAALLVAGVCIALVWRRVRRIARVREREALRGAMARVVHHLRNPVQSILLHTDLLSQGAGPQRDGHSETCLAITSEAERLAGMLRDLSLFAAGPATRLREERVPLRALLRDVARGSPDGAPAVELGAAEDAEVAGDPDELRQALDMLLANAREAVASRADPRIAVRLARRGGWAQIELQDNGDGIPRDRLPRVFDPFVSSSPKAMGLGLTIAREIVERHGGRIAIDSDPGAGTRVRVLLPRLTTERRDDPLIQPLPEVPAD